MSARPNPEWLRPTISARTADQVMNDANSTFERALYAAFMRSGRDLTDVAEKLISNALQTEDITQSNVAIREIVNRVDGRAMIKATTDTTVRYLVQLRDFRDVKAAPVIEAPERDLLA